MILQRHLRHAIRTTAALAAAALLGTALSAAESSVTLSDGAYASGGIGNEEQQALQDRKNSYNLRLTFAQSRTGEYLAGLEIAIERLDRRRTFGPYQDCGPLFYARLEPGLYRVSATYEGVVRTKTVRIGAKGFEETLYWP